MFSGNCGYLGLSRHSASETLWVVISFRPNSIGCPNSSLLFERGMGVRFRQIDKITQLEPGKSIRAEMTLSGHEDYLRDHFPRFPVQPGVMMLESLFQASQFLVRATEEFHSGLVMLKEAKNIKFGSFLQPGETLVVEAEILKIDGKVFTVKASGSNLGKVCVAGRLVIECVQDGPPNSVDHHAAEYIRQIICQLKQVAMA